MSEDRALLLALDTSTSLAIVALGDSEGRPVAEDAWRAGFRHGEELLERVDALLHARGTTVHDLAGVVVGTGPGAFTGLRVGMATAKGLGLALRRPVLGVSSGRALLEAAHDAGVRRPALLLLPAGPSDRVLVQERDPWGAIDAPVRLAPGDGVPARPGLAVVAVDLDGRSDEAASDLGRLAQAGLGRALLRLGAERLAAHGGDDLAELVPAYVTLPRGVTRETGAVVMGRA